jgi:hypothetical protein
VAGAKVAGAGRVGIAVAALMLAGASGSSQSKPAAPAPPPAGFGGPAAPNGSFGSSSVSSPNWDVQVAVSPTDAKVAEEGSTWQLTSEDNRGAITVVVMRDPSVRDARTLADSLRQDRKNKGEDVTDVEEETLVGLPGARWISVATNGVATMVVLAHTRACVYMLIASAQGTTEEVVAYFKWASALVRTVSGGAADAPACR